MASVNIGETREAASKISSEPFVAMERGMTSRPAVVSA